MSPRPHDLERAWILKCSRADANIWSAVLGFRNQSCLNGFFFCLFFCLFLFFFGQAFWNVFNCKEHHLYTLMFVMYGPWKNTKFNSPKVTFQSQRRLRGSVGNLISLFLKLFAGFSSQNFDHSRLGQLKKRLKALWTVYGPGFPWLFIKSTFWWHTPQKI